MRQLDKCTMGPILALTVFPFAYHGTAQTGKTMTTRSDPQGGERVDERLKALFAEYAKAFSSLNLQRSTSFYADSFIEADPNGSRVFKNDAQLLATLDEQKAFYEQVGMCSTKILSLTEVRISDQYSLVNIHWGSTFKKTADKLIGFDVSYVVSKIGDRPKIILFVSHEDELKALKEL